MPAAAQTPVRWDLSALFSGMDDPKIESAWSSLTAEAAEFDRNYRGKINSSDLSPSILLKAIQDAEQLTTNASKPIAYASLLFAASTSDPAVGAFLAKQMERASALSVATLFFELELQAAPDEAVDRCLADPSLASYVHFVRHARLYKNHRLSEKEEAILEETANTGSRAWERLFDEVTSNFSFDYANPETSETEKLTEQELLAILRSPNREARAAAAQGLATGLKSMERVLVFIYNNLLQDKAVDDRLRKLEFPEEARHLSNELTDRVVNLVIDMCVENYPLVARFYHVKREILGLPELTHIDRYAPLFDAEAKIPFEEGKDIILDAFGGFSQEMSQRAKEFFDGNWIDAEPRAGKQGGAFCAYNTPDTHPVVFMSYLEKSDDVMTLAHELGHGVHASVSRRQSYFNFQGTLPLAECASTFGEMLVFEKLVKRASPKDKLALYAEKLEGVFATIFRQAAMYRFEQRSHRARREEGEQTAEAFGEIWQQELQAMFGDSLTLGEEHRSFWSYVPHFIGMPFYVYAYSFGELLVLSLYEKAKAEGPAFAPRYVEMLSKGGSETPHELMESVGADLEDPEFWKGGFKAMEKLLGEFEALWAELKPSWR